MAINFPDNPTDGQTYTYTNVQYTWDGTDSYWYIATPVNIGVATGQEVIDGVENAKFVSPKSMEDSDYADEPWVAAAIAAAKQATLEAVFPVGSYYFDGMVAGVNPATRLGFGTWQKDSVGRALIGTGGSYGMRATGGATTHTLTYNEMPSHSHSVPYGGSAQAGPDNGGAPVSASTGFHTNRRDSAVNSAGGNAPHSIMQPYLAIDMWLRTA